MRRRNLKRPVRNRKFGLTERNFDRLSKKKTRRGGEGKTRPWQKKKKNPKKKFQRKEESNDKGYANAAQTAKLASRVGGKDGRDAEDLSRRQNDRMCSSHSRGTRLTRGGRQPFAYGEGGGGNEERSQTRYESKKGRVGGSLGSRLGTQNIQKTAIVIEAGKGGYC